MTVCMYVWMYMDIYMGVYRYIRGYKGMRSGYIYGRGFEGKYT